MPILPGAYQIPAIQNCAKPKAVERILQSAIEAVEPETAVLKHLRIQGNQLNCGQVTLNLAEFQRILVIGIGKAASPMAQAIYDLLGDRISKGFLIVKRSHKSKERLCPNLTIREAGHPVPDVEGVNATQELINFLSSAHSDDLVICLISGGGSALMTAPMPSIALADLQTLTGQLLACGATIAEINILRKHLDQVKGGRLASLAAPATILTLILSDVLGDPIDIIASGPTASDPSTYQDAIQVLEKYHLMDRAPLSIVNLLQSGKRGEYPETPKPGDQLFKNVHHMIVGNNAVSAKAAITQAQREGFQTLLLGTQFTGEAHQFGLFLSEILRQLATSNQPLPRPAFLIAGGETTVIIQGKGKGGRNQETALASVEPLAGLPRILMVTLATDGDDGPTDAAGAAVDGTSLIRATQLGLKPGQYLQNNDSYQFFQKLGDLLQTGPTLTNVNDLAMLFAF